MLKHQKEQLPGGEPETALLKNGYLFLLEKLPLRLEVVGLLDDFTEGVEPSLFRTLLLELDLDVDQLPVLDLLVLELLGLLALELPELVLPDLLALEPLALELLEVLAPVLDDELPEGVALLEVNAPVRSLVVGFLSSLVDAEEDAEVELLLGVLEYPL